MGSPTWMEGGSQGTASSLDASSVKRRLQLSDLKRRPGPPNTTEEVLTTGTWAPALPLLAACLLDTVGDPGVLSEP